MKTLRTSAAFACATALTLPLVTGLPAAAQPLARERIVYQDIFDVECGETTFEGEVNGTLNLVFVERGRSGLPHFNGTIHEQAVFTNPDTGRTYTNVGNYSDRDFSVTDNGDGTLTVVVQTAGVSKWYDADGKLLYIDSGMQRFELVVDHSGTPGDPFDDGETTYVGEIRELTGKKDTFDRDFCTDLLTVTG